MGDLHDHRHAAQQHDLVAPVKLEGLSRREAQRNVSRRRRLSAVLGPSPGIATHRIVTAVIAPLTQVLEQADQGQLLAGGLGRIAGQQCVELFCPSPEFRSGLDFTLVFERRLARPQHFADRVSGHLQVPRDLLDRLALDEVLAPNPRNRFHDQHPLTTRFESKREACNGHTSGGHFWTPIPQLRGSKLHAE